MIKLSKLQEEILSKDDDKIVVMARARSGKTALLTEKVRRELRGGVDPKTMAVITFTNMAAEELRQRLGDDYKDGLFIGTVHALANRLLLMHGVDTGLALQKEEFDELFEMVQDHPECAQKIDYVVLDEAQDSNELQFDFLFHIINPTRFFVVGDVRQSIYRWAGRRPELLDELMRSPGVKSYSLNENYRNAKEILDYARRISYKTGEPDDSVAMREGYGYVTKVAADLGEVVSLMEKGGNYGDWAILTRTNQQLDETQKFLWYQGIPCDSFKQGDLDKEQLDKRMTGNTVKILTIHSAKGLEWDNVVVIGARYFNTEEVNIRYVAATRAKNTLFWVKNGKPSMRKALGGRGRF